MKSTAAATLAALTAAPISHLAGAFTTAPRSAIQPLTSSPSRLVIPSSKRLPSIISLHSSPNNNDDNEEEEEKENRYADPEYPDLEFINYDDPSYSAFQDSDLSPPPSSSLLTEEEILLEIESMREERRRRNDEFQFETYHSKVLRGGQSSYGEWTVFQTDTFMEDLASSRGEDARHVPRLLKWDKVLKVISRGNKLIIDENAEWRVDGERIVHTESLANIDDFPKKQNVEIQWDDVEVSHVQNRFWPIQMTSLDFRGAAGNMCVGNAYTICDAVPIRGKAADEESDDTLRHEGPFSELRTELGVTDGDIRFRVKLDYATLDTTTAEEEGSGLKPPPLHLRTLTVCRETLDGFWPKPIDNGIDLEAEEEQEHDGISESTARRKDQDRVDVRLFGPSGAPGGLYDPPPVGSEERAVQNYMLLDFEGGATVLLPHKIDQHSDEDNDDTFGWVTSLDWTPGKIRYQVDRKVLGGRKLKGLKTLELSEVRGEDADRWRPKDGGVDMRQ